MTRGLALRDVRAAAARLHGYVRTTPLLESTHLNALVGGRVLLKAECLQETGSFKFRGALNALLLLDTAARQRGVIAYSSGNHALAVSHAARLLGVPAVVVMPQDAPAPKIEGARRAGAEVVLYDRLRDDRESLSLALVEAQGLSLVPPFDHYAVMAGQGTVALEALAQASAVGAAIDTLLVPCSGGGLAAGCATVLRAHSAQARIATVEPEGFDDMALSLASGAVARNAALSGSLCDALLVPSPGQLTLPLLRHAGATGLRVLEDSVRRAMRFAMEHLKLVVEPGGVVALAAVLQDRRAWQGRTVLLVLSGGNASPGVLRDVLHRQELAHA